MNDPCGWCDHPAEGHGTRYAAGRGDHTWEKPKGGPFVPAIPDRAQATEPVGTAVPWPVRQANRDRAEAAGASGYPIVQADTPSDRLPPRLAMPPELRRSPTNTELDQQEMAAGASGYWLPSDPPEENINDHDMHCPPADLPVHTDRPSIIRRILNARKAST